jgi:hypothetical protein
MRRHYLCSVRAFEFLLPDLFLEQRLRGGAKTGSLPDLQPKTKYTWFALKGRGKAFRIGILSWACPLVGSHATGVGIDTNEEIQK